MLLCVAGHWLRGSLVIKLDWSSSQAYVKTQNNSKPMSVVKII